MAKAERGAKKGGGSRLLGLLNPIRDPSLLVAIILTVIEEGGSGHEPAIWLLVGLLNWVAVKAIIWLLVNFAFSFVYLIRKTFWVVRNPRLAWRLLDALGTEEIIIGGLRPDMFATEDGGLHEGQLGLSMAAYANRYASPMSAPAYDNGYDEYGYGNGRQQNGYQSPPSFRLDQAGEDVRELLTQYAKLISDWTDYTEEKWRAVSDSQLGWKPLRGRWNGWEEIYRDSFGDPDGRRALQPALDAMAKRYENATSKGSAASSVACFLHDLDNLRQGLIQLEGGEDAGAPRMGGIESKPSMTRTNKAPIIRNPMIVDADR